MSSRVAYYASLWQCCRAPALWILAIVGATLIPYLAAIYGVPAGSVFRGSLRPSTDAAQYLAAVRMGAAGDWLWRDPFVIRSPAPILMFPTYYLAGHIGALLHVAPRIAFIAYHVFSVLLLAIALWRLAGIFLLEADSRIWFVAFALCTSNFLWMDALLAVFGHAPVRVPPLEHETVSGLSMGLISGHYAIGLAGHVMVLTGLAGFLSDQNHHRWRRLPYGAGGMLVLGLASPVYLPLTFAVLATFTIWFALQTEPRGRWLPRTRQAVIACGLIALPGIIFAVYYFILFYHGVWSAFKQSGQESVVGSLFDWGYLVPVAVWAWYAAPRSLSPLSALLGLWCVVAIGGWALNLYQGSRLTDGITVPMGGLIALALSKVTPRTRRRVFGILSFSLVCQYVFLLSSLLEGNSTPLYNSAPEARALQWLAQNGKPADVMLSPFNFANVIPERSRVHVVAGHDYQTYDLDKRYSQLLTFFGAHSTVAQRLRVLRESGATLVAYDGSDLYEGPYDPRGLPGLRLVFASGNVAILRIMSRY